MSNKKIRIGGFSAFWGDTMTSAYQLVSKGGHIDYLIGDYLAEVTLCILARVKAKKKASGGAGEGGYVADFLYSVWKPLMKPIMDRNIKIITNAGGMNPYALKVAIEEMARKAGVPIPKVGVVLGDDLTSNIQQLRDDNNLLSFKYQNEDELLWHESERIMSSNAYLGAKPIVEALKNDAQIVITGRCVDSALVLGPLLYEFGWNYNDYDRLSMGSLAGHIIECGAQCTGGNFTDWKLSSKKGWDNVGFPIAECYMDGSFMITKPDDTGGIVNFGTVAEQLLYEIDNPEAYILPDVICDWSNVHIKEIKNAIDCVLVTGAKGRAPSQYYKVGTTTLAGFKTSGGMLISGFEAAEKAEKVANGILTKVERMLSMRNMDKFIAKRIELIGAETTYGQLSKAQNNREIMLRITVAHKNPKALAIFAKELAPAATGMAPGIGGAGMGGRPKPSPLIRYYSCLVKKKDVPIQLKVGNNFEVDCSELDGHEVAIPHMPISIDVATHYSLNAITKRTLAAGFTYVPLITLAYGRSGDKGNSCNIGIIARQPSYFDFIKKQLTAQRVKDYLPHLLHGKVVRYELIGVNAFNFVCTNALGGGGIASLNLDTQGKSYAQKLLSFPIIIPIKMLENDRNLLTNPLLSHL